MPEHFKKIFHALGLICFFSLMTAACDDRQQAKAPQKPVVVSQKVVAPKVANAPPHKMPENSQSSKLQTSSIPKKTETEKKSSQLGVAPPARKIAAETKNETPSEEPLSPERLYDPIGKIDPFAPLFSEKKGVSHKAGQEGREKRIPQTPLEKIDLSQLKLVGILRSESKNRALVEEASGKGYIITEGTYIGKKSGKVVQILADRAIIEEESENLLGKVSLVKRELKLQKAFGED